MNDIEILLIGNPILNLLGYIFVILLIFNLLKVNYYNPIVALLLKIYKPISKILFLFPNQIINIIMISLVIKFLSLYVFAEGQVEILVLIAVAVIQILIAILRIIFYAVIGGVIISWVSPNLSLIHI